MQHANLEIKKKVEEILQDRDTKGWHESLASETTKTNYPKHVTEYLLHRDLSIKQMIKNNGFHLAKISKNLISGNPDHVLCLYYESDSRNNELAKKYQAKNGIKYRFWKSDEDTRKGKYSKDFLDKLD